MSEFRGILLISGSQSSVNGDILLMAGDQDPDSAISGATSFVKRKGFQSGFSIIVTGSKGQVGDVSGIVMTSAAAPAVVAPAAMVEAAARTIISADAAKPGKKAFSKKRTATARKKTKKSSPKKARKQTAKRKTQKKSKRNR
jgi:hypothetical protein